MVKVQIDGLDVLNDINAVGTFKLLDTGTDPTGEGEMQRNASDVKVYAGGKVISLSNQQVANITATAAPGVTNDTTEGYEPGSPWIDVTADKAYVCLDATEGAAVWSEIGKSALVSNLQSGSRTAAAGNGTVNITGIGFQPAAMIMLMLCTTESSFSMGFLDDDNDEMQIHYNTDATLNHSDTNPASVNDGLGKGYDVAATFTSDGVDLVFTKNGAGMAVEWKILFLR